MVDEEKAHRIARDQEVGSLEDTQYVSQQRGNSAQRTPSVSTSDQVAAMKDVVNNSIRPEGNCDLMKSAALRIRRRWKMMMMLMMMMMTSRKARP